MPEEDQEVVPDFESHALAPETRSSAPDRDRVSDEKKRRQLANRDFSQRFWHKRVAVYVGIMAVSLLFALLGLSAFNAIWMPPESKIDNAAVAIALIVVPIASITAIVIALLIGAFRKFDDKGIRSMGGGISGAAMKIYGGN